MSGAICGVSRGKYMPPIPVKKAKLRFENDNYKRVKRPEKYYCEHEEHNQRKKNFPLQKMFYQDWHLTKKELNEAIYNYDIFSLEMKGRIICGDCAKKIWQRHR